MIILSKHISLLLKTTFSLFFLFLCLHTTFSQTTYTWNGSTSSNVATAANWTPNGVPFPTDHVIIDGTGANSPQLPGGGATVTNCTVSGDVIDCNGATLTITGTATFSGGTINNGTVAISSTATTTFSGTTFGANVSGTTGRVLFNGSTFNGTVTLDKVNNTNDDGTGGNTFNSTFSLTNSSGNRIRMGQTTADTFNGQATFTINGTGNIEPGRTTTGTAFNDNIIVNSTNTGDIIFGNNGGSCTLASGFTISVGTAFSDGVLRFLNFTQSGATAQNLTLTGTAQLRMDNAVFNGAVTFAAPRLISVGATYKAITSLSKTGAGNDDGNGGNTFETDATLNQSGSGRWRHGVTNPDDFQGNLTLINSGSTAAGDINIAYNSAGNTVGGNLTINNTATYASNDNDISIGNNAASTMDVTGNVTINNSGSANNNRVYFPNQGAVTMGGNLTINNTATGTSGHVYIANNTNSSLVMTTGNTTVTNSGVGGTTKRVYLGVNGDVTFDGTLDITNSTTATTNGQVWIADGTDATVSISGNVTATNTATSTNTQLFFGEDGDITFNGTLDIENNSGSNNSLIYLNRNSSSVNTYNENITIQSKNTTCDGISFGRDGGSGTLAATKTITIPGVDTDNFIGGELYFRNFTQTGATNHAFELASTATYIYNYDSNWGGDVDFSAPRINTRGTTYSGTADLTKTGATDDASAGGNTFTGNATLTITGTNWFRMGDGSADTFGGDLTLINSSSTNGDIEIARNSAGNTIAGNLIMTNSATWNADQNDVIVGGNAASTLAITGGVTITNSGTANNNRVYFPNQGSATVGGNIDITNSATGTSAYVYLANNANSSLVTTTSNTTVTNSAVGGTTKIVYLGVDGDITLDGTVDITQTSTATTRDIRIANGTDSEAIINGAVTINTSGVGGTDDRIYIGNNGDVTFGSSLTVTGSSSATNGRLWVANGIESSITVAGATSITNNGTGNSTRFYIGDEGDITFNGTLDLINNSGSNESEMYLNYEDSSNNTYNENITVQSTNTSSDGIRFGQAGGYGTLAATKTITIPGVDTNNFVGGELRFTNFTQVGPTDHAFELASTATYVYNYNSNWGGNVDFTAPRMLTWYTLYNGTANLTKTGGGDDDGGGNTFEGNTTLTTTKSGANRFSLGSTAADTFRVDLTMINSCASGAGDLSIARNTAGTYIGGNLTLTNSASYTANDNDISIGQNAASTVDIVGTVTITNNGSANSNRIYFPDQGAVTMGTGSDLSITNSATGTTGNVYIANNNNSSLTTDNCNTTVNNTGTGGTNKIVRLGGTGDVTFDGTLDVVNSATGTNSDVYVADEDGSVVTINGNTTATYSGTGGTEKRLFLGDDGDVTLNGTFDYTSTSTFTNTNLYIADETSSTVSITGATSIAFSAASGTNDRTYVGRNGDVTLGSTLDITNSSAATTSRGFIAYGANATVTIADATSVTNNGTGNSARFYLGNNGDITFNGTLDIVNNSGSNESEIYLNRNGSSENLYNENITIQSKNTSCDGIRFGNDDGRGTLAATKTITIPGIDTANFIGGDLWFENFTQVGATDHAFELATTARYIYNDSSSWGGNIDFSAPRMVTRYTSYAGTANLTKIGNGEDNSQGNTFEGNTTLTITKSGQNWFRLGSTDPDTFRVDLTMVNSTTSQEGDLGIARSSAGNYIGGNLVITNSASYGAGNNDIIVGDNNASTLDIDGTVTITNNGSANSNRVYFPNNAVVTIGSTLDITNSPTGTSGIVYIADDATSSLIVPGATTVTNSGTATTSRIYLGENGDITFNGILDIINSSGAANSEVYLNRSGNSTNIYNEDITVQSKHTDCDGIRFGENGGAGTLAATKTITIPGTDTDNFIGGQLRFRNFTQTGATDHSFELASTATYIYNYDSDWGGNVVFTSPRAYSRGTTYNQTSIVTKTGGSNDDWYGDNTYVGDMTIINNGTARIRTSNNVADTYQANATFEENSTGAMEPARNGTNNFPMDVTFNGAQINWGEGNGIVQLTGTGVQTIGGTSAIIRVERIVVNNTSATGVTMDSWLMVDEDITFTDGYIYTDAVNMIDVRDEATATGADDDSHVQGPIRKTGDNPFTFPVGKGTNYQPISMSAPGNNNRQFTAEYFALNPDSVTPTPLTRSSKEVTIDHVSGCEYWALERTSGASNVEVTLTWDANSCGVTDSSELIVARWDGSQWVDHGNGGVTGNTIAGTVVSSAAVTSFNTEFFTLASISGANPLPIELISFNAVANGDVVDLTWQTATEINNAYFTVERSTDGMVWEEIITTNGAGNSSNIIQYFETDYHPLNGISYYRLKQTDFDGQYEYFNIVPVKFIDNNAQGINLFPSPLNAGETVNIEFNGIESNELLVVMRDVKGREFYSKIIINVENGALVGIPTEFDIPAGIYIITATSEDQIYSQKLLIK